MAIKSFSHKGLKKLFYKGDSSGIQPIHADKLVIMLDTIKHPTIQKISKLYMDLNLEKKPVRELEFTQ